MEIITVLNIEMAFEVKMTRLLKREVRGWGYDVKKQIGMGQEAKKIPLLCNAFVSVHLLPVFLSQRTELSAAEASTASLKRQQAERQN